MSLQPGQNLQHYRIVEKIGEGGMGQVFLAVDTRLDRQVAIKILTEQLADDPTLLQRFDRMLTHVGPAPLVRRPGQRAHDIRRHVALSDHDGRFRRQIEHMIAIIRLTVVPPNEIVGEIATLQILTGNA